MNTIKIKKTLNGFGLAFAMVIGVMMFSGTSVNAQDRRGDRNDRNRYEENDRRRDDRRRSEFGREHRRFEVNRYDNSWERRREIERARLERLRWEREHRRRNGFSIRLF